MTQEVHTVGPPTRFAGGTIVRLSGQPASNVLGGGEEMDEAVTSALVPDTDYEVSSGSGGLGDGMLYLVGVSGVWHESLFQEVAQ